MPKNIFTTIKKLFPLLIVFTLCIPAISPLFHNGFFTMHDDQQIIRLAEMDRALAGGQFPVRWVQNLGFGYGYPLFIFYPPLVYYLGEVFHLLFQISFIASIKLVFAVAFIGSALTMFYWVRYHFGKLSAVTASIFYTYVPYKAVDAYVRGALAELFSFVWLPLVLLSIDHIVENRNKKYLWMIVLSVSYAALIITHTLIVLPFTLLLPFYVIARLIIIYHKTPKEILTPIIKLITSFIISVLLSAFFWLPSLAEKSLTIVDDILLTEKYTYSQHYVYPEQLWNSIWGYAGSTEGKLDGVSFKIGKLHVALSVLVFLLSVLLIFRKSKYKKEIYISLLASFLLLISAFFTTGFSSWIWDNFQPLQYLQFPWRFLTFTALFSSFLAGSFIWFVRQKSNIFIAFCTSITLFVLLLLPNTKYFKPEKYLDVTDNYYTSEEFTKWHISKTSFEFVPKGVATRIGTHGVTELAIDRDHVATTLFQSPASSSAMVKVKTDHPDLKKFSVNSPEKFDLTINSYNFPGWTAYLDGQKTEINDDNSLKLITVTIPEGDHELLVKFENTLVRNISNLLSALGFFVITSLLVKENKHKFETLIKYVR